MTELSGWQALMAGTTDEQLQNRGQSIVSLTRATGRQTALFATSAEFFHLYGSSADRNEQGDDEAMTAALCQVLTASDAPALSVVELSCVRRAGDEHGFFDEAQNIATPQTIAAIAKADAAIARIIKTLRSRERYAQERWLVAVTSNCGGLTDNTADNVYDRMDRKTFSMLWSDGTQGEMLQRPSSGDVLEYKYFALRYNGTGETECATVGATPHSSTSSGTRRRRTRHGLLITACSSCITTRAATQATSRRRSSARPHARSPGRTRGGLYTAATAPPFAATPAQRSIPWRTAPTV